MQNGRILKSLVVALSLGWLGGCDLNATSNAVQVSRKPESRQHVDGGRGSNRTLTREGLFLRQIASAEQRAIALDAHQDMDFGFTSLAYSARDGAFVAVSAMPNARWRIDAAPTRAEKIESLHPVAHGGSQ